MPNEINRIVERVLTKRIPKRFVPIPPAEFRYRRSIGIEDEFLVREDARHENERADPFFDAGKNSAGMSVVTVADERHPRWIDIAPRNQQVDAATEINH